MKKTKNKIEKQKIRAGKEYYLLSATVVLPLNRTQIFESIHQWF
jgi:hypothetical protein